MRGLKRLTARKVELEKKAGLYADGLGLYLQVGTGGAKSWIYRYRVDGRLRDMGLGSCHAVSLAEARERAAECRKVRAHGVDPIDKKRAAAAEQKKAQAKAMTFKACSGAYIEAHRSGWKNAKHAAQWSATLETYAYPVLGDLAVDTIDTALILKVLEPIWITRTETASRVRGRIESVLDWARVRGHREGENPARWRGHLDHLLPKRNKIATVKHHAALPIDDVPPFMVELRTQDGVAARALEFAILTATRTSETIGATWAEIDLNKRLWTIPPDRMKAGKEHRVPLSTGALRVLEEMSKLPRGVHVFPGARRDKGLSNMALLAVLRRMGRGGLTTHGFRSTFRDWAAERTHFAHEVAEMALAHTVSNKVEAAYRRGDLFEKRRALNEEWSCFCKNERSKITTMKEIAE
jgi:integrase